MWTSARQRPSAEICTLGIMLIVACGTNSSEPSTGGTADSTSEVSNPPDASTTASNPTDDPTATGGSTETGNTPGLNHEICNRYLACVAAVAPGSLPMAQQGFGEDGTCWQGTEAEMQQCIDACKAGLAQFHTTSPDEPDCALCQGNADCGTDETCEDGECRSTSCGDGIVESNEVCDDTEFCDPDCAGPVACSPFNGAGCTGDKACVFDSTQPACMPDRGLIPIGDECSSGTCDEGSVCLNVEGCETPPGIPCCKPICNATLGSEACPPGLKCYSFKELGTIDGFYPPDELAEYIGYCHV